MKVITENQYLLLQETLIEYQRILQATLNNLELDSYKKEAAINGLNKLIVKIQEELYSYECKQCR